MSQSSSSTGRPTGRLASWADVVSPTPAVLPAPATGKRRTARRKPKKVGSVSPNTAPWPDRHEVMRLQGGEWRKEVRAALMQEGITEDQADKFIKVLAWHLGGLSIYLGRRDPKQKAERDQSILEQYRRGLTRRAIAKLHRISASQVQRVIAQSVEGEGAPAGAAGVVPLSAGKGTSRKARCKASGTTEPQSP